MQSKNMEILKALSGAIEEVTTTVSPSVVSVGSDHRVGTGVVFDGGGRIVTAAHVVHRLDEVEVGFGDGSTQKAKVVGRNPYSDLALLQARDGGHPVEIGSSEELKAGQFVLAMANPHGGRPSVTSGIITGVNRHIGGWWRFSVSNAVVTDARLNPGYSGGPLLDVQGRMIGMNVAYVSNRGIAVPVDSVRKDVERISSGQGFRRAYLGIVSNPVSLPEDVSTRPEVNQESGLMIFSVESGSAAKKAGLALGDVLVKFGNHPVGDFQALESLLGEEAVGKETKLLVLRGEEPTELTIVPSVAE